MTAHLHPSIQKAVSFPCEQPPVAHQPHSFRANAHLKALPCNFPCRDFHKHPPQKPSFKNNRGKNIYIKKTKLVSSGAQRHLQTLVLIQQNTPGVHNLNPPPFASSYKHDAPQWPSLNPLVSNPSPLAPLFPTPSLQPHCSITAGATSGGKTTAGKRKTDLMKTH